MSEPVFGSAQLLPQCGQTAHASPSAVVIIDNEHDAHPFSQVSHLHGA